MDTREIIKELRTYLNFKTDTELADFLGIKPNTLSSWYTRNTLDAALIISKCDKVDANWLLTGKGHLLKPANGDGGIVKAPPGKVARRPKGDSPVPFHEVDFEAGTGVAFYEDIRSSKPAYTMDVPDFAGCTAFRTYGKSMQPLIDSGAILFGTDEKDWKHGVEYGQIFGIVCKPVDGFTRRYLKWVRKSDRPKTHFLLRSANPDYDDMDLDCSKIKSMWLIHGWINKNT